MMESLSTPYAQGIYTGAAGVGLITGMAMMRRREAFGRAVKAIRGKTRSAAIDDPWDNVVQNFGYPCGNSFTSDRHKCYTDPKTGVKLKKPITRQIYDKIMKSDGKAAQTFYKDREDRIRSSRRAGAKGWKKDLIANNPDYQRKKKALTRNMVASQYPFSAENVVEIDAPTAEIKSQLNQYQQDRAEKVSLLEKTQSMRLDRKKKESRIRFNAENIAVDDLRIERHSALLEKRAKDEAKGLRAKNPPASPPELTLDKVETSLDREKFAAQQLADAKARGDKNDIKAWDDAAKKTRKERLNESVAKTKQTQGTLFDTTVMDDSPLMRKLREQGDFGYACGQTFIPDAAKCYTDPKTGVRLRTPLTKAQVERVRSKSPGADRLYSQQEQQIKNRLRGGIIPPEFQAAARSTEATKVLPSGIAEVNPKNLHLDPKRFQYKLVTGSTGESGSLTGVRKWDANLAGVQLAWHDPADQKTYVINGHNRTNLAKKLGVESVTTRFIKANTAKEARAIGAITNVAEGNGTSLDAAKFFRDSNLTQDDLTKKGIPLKSSVATEGVALAKLNDGLFNKVVQGDLTKERGVIIGKNLSDHKEQSELIDLIDKQEKKGKKITNEGIAELTEMVQNAPKKQAEGGFLGMLGFSPEARSLAVEKAEIQAHIKRQLATEKKLFGTVGRTRNAQRLERGGNKIDSEQSSAISADADRALRIFDQEKRYSGRVSTAINLAAERIANGEKASKVKDEIYKQTLELIK